MEVQLVVKNLWLVKAWWFFTRLTYAAYVCCGNLRSDQTGQQRLCPVVLEQLVRQQVCSSPGPQGSRERTGCPLGNLFFPPIPCLNLGVQAKPIILPDGLCPSRCHTLSPSYFSGPLQWLNDVDITAYTGWVWGLWFLVAIVPLEPSTPLP